MKPSYEYNADDKTLNQIQCRDCQQPPASFGEVENLAKDNKSVSNNTTCIVIRNLYITYNTI